MKITSTRGRQQKPEFEEIDVVFDLDLAEPEGTDETEQLEFWSDDWSDDWPEDILPITGID